MEKIFYLTFTLMLVLGLSSFANEIVYNGDLEIGGDLDADPAGFHSTSSGAVVLTQDQTHGGSYAAKITFAGTAYTKAYQYAYPESDGGSDVPQSHIDDNLPAAGEELSVSSWIYMPSGTGDGLDYVFGYVLVRFRDATGDVSGGYNSGYNYPNWHRPQLRYISDFTGEDSAVADSWQEITYDLVVTDTEYDRMALATACGTLNDGDFVYFDDFSVSSPSPPPASAISSDEWNLY